jgi:hypothetical protein
VFGHHGPAPRRDEWIQAGIFEDLEDLCVKAADKVLGLELDNLTVDGCIVKAPCGGEAAGRSPVDRGEQGTKRSLMIEGTGLLIGFVSAPPTGSTPRSWRRPWSSWPDSVSTSPLRSRCTWMRDMTRRRPASWWTAWDVSV